jgi:hypothetical protein
MGVMEVSIRKNLILAISSNYSQLEVGFGKEDGVPFTG